MIMRLMMSSPTMNACVSIMRAALTLSSDRRMLAMTDEPMPTVWYVELLRGCRTAGDAP